VIFARPAEGPYGPGAAGGKEIGSWKRIRGQKSQQEAELGPHRSIAVPKRPLGSK
jgi:hypothetical protein